MQALFSRWEGLEVRLDVWHFMRRLARGCTSESHPLYATWMSKLSACIFEWDRSDVDLLVHAKRSELVMAGLTNLLPQQSTRLSQRKSWPGTVVVGPGGTDSTTTLIRVAAAPSCDSHRHTRCAPVEARHQPDLARAETAHQMSAGSPWSTAVHHNQQFDKGWGDTACLPLCQGVYINTEFPSTPSHLHS